MALHPDFQRWLSSRGLQPATLNVLQKEKILQESTLKLLTDSDLDSLKEKHGISLGQFALLRSARGNPSEGASHDIGDDFEIIELEDVPTSMAVGHGSKEGSTKDRHSSAGKRDRTGMKGVMSDNLDKAFRREERLRNTADASEQLASSTAEFSRLTTLLAEKKRKEAGGRLIKRSSKSNTSVDRATPAAGNLSSNYDHLDNFVPPSSNRRHIQDVDTDQTSPRHGKQVAATDRKQTQEESEIKSDTDGKTECCTIL